MALRLLFIFLTSSFFISDLCAAASPEKSVFEGYYKVTAGQKHIGFVVHRYSFSEEKKQFRSTYYLKTNKLGGNVTESLNAVANDKFEPISYQFTQTAGTTAKIIDAKFKGTAMQATVSNGQQAQNVTKTFPKGSFLSTFLGYLMLQRGLITDKHYQYNGIAEEDAKVYKGNAYIKKDLENRSGMKMFKVLNVFKDTKFSSLINDKGEVFGTRSPAQKISTELVSSPSEATSGIPVNSQHLKKLFGSIPVGNIHDFQVLKGATSATTLSTQPTTPADSGANSGKDVVVPIGQPGGNKKDQ